MANTVNCCWNNDQNTADPINKGINEITRLRSVGVICFEAPITINSTTAAITVRITTTSERFSAVKMPNSTANTMTTTPAIPTNDQRTASRRLSGFIALRLDSVMVWWRMSQYCTNPINITTAASPKPQWKPFQPHTAEVNSGPISPPMLTPI